MNPFLVHSEYRREELLSYVGSRQAQSGVIWGDAEPGCVILTTGGRHGKKAGYFDQCLPDGSWWYFGQGQKGDHTLANAANRIILEENRSILLFSAREPTSKEIQLRGSYAKFFKFLGNFNFCKYEIVTPDYGERRGDKLIRFLLAPSINCDPVELSMSDSIDLAELRRKILVDASVERLTNFGVREYRLRSAEVRKYAVLRARGICEACELNAPFLNIFGQPYLEVHHIWRLADDGFDSPENVAAICPNCHRRAHYSLERAEFNKGLSQKILRFEQTILSKR